MTLRYATGLLILFSVHLYGVTIDDPERRLVVRHSKPATVTIGESDASQTTALAATMSFTRRHDEVIRVIIDDPDPLVFSYKWQGTSKAQTDDYKAALAFADTVGSFGKALSAFAPPKEGTQNAPAEASATPQVGSRIRSILADLNITGADLQKATMDLTKLSDWARQVPRLTSDSAQSKDAAERVKQTVLGWDVEATARDAQNIMTKLEDASDQLLVRLLNTREGSPLDPSHGSVSNAPGRSGSTGTIAPGGKAGSKAQAAPPIDQKAPADLSDQDLAFAYLLARSKSQRVDDLAKALRTFVSTAKRINEPITLDPIEYSAGDTVTGTLVIGAAPGAETSDVEMRETGTFRFVTNPYTPVHLRNIAPAAVYSFVEVPRYSTKALPNGKYQIVRTDSGNAANGLTMAGMLSLTPVRWSSPTVGGAFQVGVSPVKDRLAILGGATLNLYDLFSVGGGFIYQQAQRLGPNLRENEDDLASADALKTTTRFKTGFYLSITVKPK